MVVRMLPNPALKGAFSIKFNNKASGDVTIRMDIKGNILYQKQTKDSNLLIHQNFMSGVYIVEVITNKKEEIQRLLIE